MSKPGYLAQSMSWRETSEEQSEATAKMSKKRLEDSCDETAEGGD